MTVTPTEVIEEAPETIESLPTDEVTTVPTAESGELPTKTIDTDHD